MKKTNKEETPKPVINEITEQLQGYTEEMEVTKEEIKPETQEPEKPVKKETRGRKPGGKNKAFKIPEPEPPKQLLASDLISGALFLMLIDLAIPNLIAFANNQVSKKKIKPKLLQLTDKQKQELEPFANEVTKQLLIKGNPLYVFIGCLVGMYGLNFMLLKNE